MSGISAKIHLIEDDTRSAVSLERLLKSEGYDVTVSHRGDEGLAHAQSEQCDVVITDLRMPGIDGLDLVLRLHAAKPRLPIVLMTAFGTTETVIEATKRGAFEYLIKPFEMEDLLGVIAKAVASARMMSEPVDLGEPASAREAIVGNSRVMQEVCKQIGRVAAKAVTVLIRGETGTGKELVARAIYQHSARADKPFIAVNCAAIPEMLLESELFGHERGAFTGADSRRIGRFEQADGGTLFLDEIGDLSVFTQAKLLRVLQEKCVQRVGGKEAIPVDVRIIAATHRDLEQAILAKQFRQDLFYRLASFVIHLPPLRNRLEDVPDLVRFFLRRFSDEIELGSAGIQADAIDWLKQQFWPGNVRQLANVIRQALLLARNYPVLDQEPRRPSLLSPGVDRDLETICLKCLEKFPERRYASAEALAENLDRWLRREPIQSRPITQLERVAKRVRRRPALAALMGVSCLLLVIIAVGSTFAAFKISAARNLEARTAANLRRTASNLRQNLYAADMNIAFQTWQYGDRDRTHTFLEKQPADLRTWEWRYL